MSSPLLKLTKRAPLLEIIFVFSFAWATLIAYALTGGDLRIFDVQLEKADIRAYLPSSSSASQRAGPAPRRPSWLEPPSPDPPPPVATSAAAPSQSGAVSAEPVARPVDPSRQRIMIFGDSMIEGLMARLADYCLHNRHVLFPVIWYGATTISWAQDPEIKLDRLLDEFKPTFVIAVIGSNELNARSMRHRSAAVKIILRKLEGRKHIWIGPPNWRPDTGINDILERTVGTDHFFRSAGLTMARKADKIHPTKAAAAGWMDAVVRWIISDSAVPIRLDQPTVKAKRPSARAYAPPR